MTASVWVTGDRCHLNPADWLRRVAAAHHSAPQIRIRQCQVELRTGCRSTGWRYCTLVGTISPTTDARRNRMFRLTGLGTIWRWVVARLAMVGVVPSPGCGVADGRLPGVRRPTAAGYATGLARYGARGVRCQVIRRHQRGWPHCGGVRRVGRLRCRRWYSPVGWPELMVGITWTYRFSTVLQFLGQESGPPF